MFEYSFSGGALCFFWTTGICNLYMNKYTAAKNEKLTKSYFHDEIGIHQLVKIGLNGLKYSSVSSSTCIKSFIQISRPIIFTKS